MSRLCRNVSLRRGPICSERRFLGGDDLYLIHIMMKGPSNEKVSVITNHFGEEGSVGEGVFSFVLPTQRWGFNLGAL